MNGDRLVCRRSMKGHESTPRLGGGAIGGMESREEHGFAVVPYQRRHRPAIRRICVDTAWMGEPAPERIGDEWVWAEFWTRYFTDHEPRHTWVVEASRGGEVAGYLTGTADAARVDRYAVFLLPGIVCRVIRKRLMRRPASRRVLLRMARSLISGELDVPARVRRQYPATLHIDLLPQARGRGIAPRLFRRYVEAMRRLGVPGLHAQSLGDNEAIAAFNRRVGFRLIETKLIHAFVAGDGQPVNVCTWVMAL